MKLKLSLLFAFISIYGWSQSTTQTFNANGTFTVPAGVTSLFVQAWGGGGAGGGAAGSDILFGRSGAGGGGGAFASAPITVTPASVLNVVVAGSASGTSGANGTAGGNSTITGFESSILAAGGSGGAANLGTAPAGANGGTVAASAGTVRIAGGNGGAGSTSLISLLLTSGAGGAGGNSGGAGGASVSSLVLGNGPGNAGIAPGGAGSGAINSALGGPQVGGVGGAGRVVITYTCPVFSLTNTAASNICFNNGTTSTVTLTGSAASLPVGNYVVTYNRTNPDATGLTANLTVTTAGTGTFTAVGLTNTGTSTLTITKLASQSCISNITTNNTATITILPEPVGGTVTGGTTICSGNTSGVLTLTGNVGTVVKWQYAVSPFTTWINVPNPGSNNAYTSTALTETTQFRAVVGNSCGTVNSEATTVIVNPAPSIQIENPSNSFCANIDNYQTLILNFNTEQGNPNSYSIVWDPPATNYFINFIDAILPSAGMPIRYGIIARIPAGTYTGTLTVKDANGCVSQGTIITLNFYDVPSGQSQQFKACSFFQYADALTDINVNATSYSINWDSLPDQGDTPYDFASNTTINNVVVPSGLSEGTYSGVISFSNGTCTGQASITLSISACEDFRAAQNNVTVNSANKVLTIDSSQENINQVYVYNVSGNLLYKKDAVSGTKLVINNLKSGNQLLVVKVVLGNNKVETRKVVY